MAHHTGDSVLQSPSAISVTALLLDLEKAFDRALREAVMGYRILVLVPSTDAVISIMSVFRLWSFEILRMNESRPPLLEEWGVSAKATRLIAAMHSGSWFRYGECPSVAETRHGGRQGCKLGSTIFNVLYAEALVRLQNKLARVVCPNQPFDPENVDTGSVVLVIDIVYVDDLTVLSVAASPASLRRALDTLLISSIELFTPLDLAVNWNLDKTEVMLKFRGSGSVADCEKLRSEHGLGVPIQGTDLRVNVVPSYKHLGGVLHSNHSNMVFVEKRASCAMTSYVPLACRVFSSPFIDVMCKRAFAKALVESSLSHLAYVKSSA